VGEIVGYATQGQKTLSFAFKNGNYRRLKLRNASRALVLGINHAGTELTGTAGIDAFVYQNGSLQRLSFPNASSTTAYGVNDKGEVSGLFNDTNGFFHGFTWMPPGDAAKK
jgi:uncharacterized membrane protein